MMKKQQTLMITVAALLLANGAQAAVIASWDAWALGTGTGAGGADSVVSGFTATAVTGLDRAISVFTSNDGTFGTLSGANTTNTVGVGLRQNSTPILTVTLTNGTTSAYRIDSLHFDYQRRQSSPDAFVIAYVSGGLGPASTTIATQSGIAWNTGDYASGAADFPDYDYNLSPALTDTVLGVGESATFTFTFNNGVNTNSGIFDNLAFQGVAVPEPSAALLGGMGALLLLRRRK